MEPVDGGSQQLEKQPEQDSEPQPETSGDETDEKKEIQQKTGEITQLISKLKDPDLAKYVVGMVNSIAGKYLSDDDKEKAINKLNKATADEQQNPETQPTNESVNVAGLVDEVMNDKKNDSQEIKKPSDYCSIAEKLYKPSILNKK
jgi:hypothetical protein